MLHILLVVQAVVDLLLPQIQVMVEIPALQVAHVL
jgi:hypothetical protein